MVTMEPPVLGEPTTERKDTGEKKKKRYPYLFLLIHSDGLRGVKLVGSSVLPHALSAVCYKPAIQHPAGQGKAQVHPDVIVESPVVG